MGRTLNERVAQLPRARRGKISRRASELSAEEMSLRELRHARGCTQGKLARHLGVGQDTVSRYEQRADLLLSTLRHYVAKMGGKLDLVAEFPDRKPVRITGFGEITESAERRRGAGGS